MIFARWSTLFLLLALLAGCTRPPMNQPAQASLDGVSLEELTKYLDWQAEMRAFTRRVEAEAKAVVNASTDINVRMEVAKRNQALAQPLLAREPFREGKKGQAMRAVTQAFYATGTFQRNEGELAKLRDSYGKELIDSIANQEALIRSKLESVP